MGLWTEDDVRRQAAKFNRSAASGQSSTTKAQNEPDALKSNPRALQGYSGASTIQDKQARKEHKFRAEPCIVTADFTVFTTADLQQLAYAQGRPDQANSKTSLRVRALQLGISGDWFGSLKEGRRWIELSQFQKVGAIRGLERQPNFDLFVTSPNGQSVKIGFFHADFRYVTEDGQTIIEDTKSTATATEAYRLRKRMVEAQYGISITET